MALKIRWTSRALDEIIDYLENNWGEKEINKFFIQLEKALQSVTNHPKRNKISQRKSQT